MLRLLVLFTTVPLVELYLLLFLGRAVGLWPTVLLVLVTGILGASLAKREGFRVLREWQTALSQGRMPREGVLGGLLVLVGGVLLVTPGVITDAVGLSLLMPWTRRLWLRWAERYQKLKVQTVQARVVGQPSTPPWGAASQPPPPKRVVEVVSVRDLSDGNSS